MTTTPTQEQKPKPAVERKFVRLLTLENPTIEICSAILANRMRCWRPSDFQVTEGTTSYQLCSLHKRMLDADMMESSTNEFPNPSPLYTSREATSPTDTPASETPAPKEAQTSKEPELPAQKEPELSTHSNQPLQPRKHTTEEKR